MPTDVITFRLDREQVLECLPRCETCKHWDRSGRPNSTQGDCERLEALASSTRGTYITVDRDEDDNPRHAYLTTQSDFGCLLWEGHEQS